MTQIEGGSDNSEANDSIIIMNQNDVGPVIELVGRWVNVAALCYAPGVEKDERR
jgi:hypothetical protein